MSSAAGDLKPRMDSPQAIEVVPMKTAETSSTFGSTGGYELKTKPKNHSRSQSRAGSLDGDAPFVDAITEAPHFSKTSWKKNQAVISHYTNVMLATAFFRIYQHVFLSALWAMAICLINTRISKHVKLQIPSTLLTVFGTVLALVLSFRTSSAYDRYWEGRRLWSTITFASRSFARTVWIQCPDSLQVAAITDPALKDEDRAKAIIEKKSVINLIQAFSVAVKHYLRGEDGIYYEDLYHLVKHLPAYNLPESIPTPIGARVPDPFEQYEQRALASGRNSRTSVDSASDTRNTSTTLPILTIQTPAANRPVNLRVQTQRSDSGPPPALRPAISPPVWKLREMWPFRWFVPKEDGETREREEGNRDRKERMAGRGVVSHNVPLELTFYLSSYVAALTTRNTIDVPVKNLLLAPITQLTETLTSLERILTSPIPFSYSAHLWVVAILYIVVLPFQIQSTFGWVTVPAVALISFVFLGFLAIGEEIENPFGMDRNDLNLDAFCHLIKDELIAITSRPMPTPADWAFSTENNTLFGEDLDSRSAKDLVKLGENGLRHLLAEQAAGPVEGGDRTPATAGAGLRQRTPF